MSAPLFSILHPTARPHKWREIYDAWMSAAVHSENVEYVLCADERWGFDRHYPGKWIPPELRAQDRIVWNTDRRCYVDSVNTAAKFSTGRILIVIADDQYPCEEWDERLAAKLFIKSDAAMLDKDWVMEVSTGTPNEHDRGMIVMPILSRARYERLGYVFYPEYESMYADNDFYEHAKHDGCIIDARHLMFPHRHPSADVTVIDLPSGSKGSWANTTWDAAYAAQNRPEAYALGERVLRKRRNWNFGNQHPLDAIEAPAPLTLASTGNGARPVPGILRGNIALALPGDHFSGVWVAKILEITAHLLQTGWNYATLINYTSNAGITRQTICNQISQMSPTFKPDYILWIDDDQVVESGIVDMLLADAEALPDADIVAGWTWIASNGAYFNVPQVSCGRMNLDKGELSHAEYRSVQSANGVFEVQWTGFPVVLMRPSAIEKAGKHPFAHLPCPESPWGECGEDISFCKRLQDAGGKIYVDSRAFVSHLKLKPLGPDPEAEAAIGLALSGKSEGFPYDVDFNLPPLHAKEQKEGMKPPVKGMKPPVKPMDPRAAMFARH